MASGSMTDFEKYSKMGLRRLRSSKWIRELVAESRVHVEQMMQPLFAVDGISKPETVPGMTGVFRETADSLLKQVENDLEAGVRKFILFGVPADKREKNFSADFTSRQISEIRKRFGKDLFLAVDVCLCSYTTHGHCGVIPPEGDHVDNEASVQELANLALSYAQSGADCVAPSDMMDGRIGAIRTLLNEKGLYSTLLMSYSAKFNSKFYGPFRNAADSAPKSPVLKDRASYQIDPSRMSDAYLSSVRDAEEGADILMVKPGMPNLDVLARLSDQIKLPWAVYEVSGEYAGVEVLAQNGLISAPAAHLEAWTGMVRAGASIIITYGARNAKKYLAGV